MLARRKLGHAAASLILGMLFALSASPLAAQRRPPQKKARVDTSTGKAIVQQGKRIVTKHAVAPITKEAGGEVALPKCDIDEDSLNNAIDAVRQEEFMRAQLMIERQRVLDSAYAAIELRRALSAERAASARALEAQRAQNAAAQAERDRQEALAHQLRLARGWYLGFAGGMSTPQRDVRDGYATGWNATIPLGWDATDAPYGFRVDYSVDHLDGTAFRDAAGNVLSSNGAITIWSLNSDVKLRIHAPGTPTRTHLYALGGVGEHRVTDGVYGTTGPHAGKLLSFGNAKTRFGWNAGAGAAMAWGPAELFVETRFLQVASSLTYHANGGIGRYTSFAPIVVGVQWF